MQSTEDAKRSRYEIRSVDTDLAVLIVSTVSELGGGLELWVAFGTVKDFRLIAVHEIAESLGPMRCYALPRFHSLTGCDATSYFQHIGKRTAWKIWKLSDMLTTALCSLRKDPKNLQDSILHTVKRFYSFCSITGPAVLNALMRHEETCL
ncbi:hypothetical protein ElyMa_001375200 [Elysia marginata]|uniref:Uncharacterized protein n=1 Tax=Elysia marginata TaxID=1093978 RepID=A0AAV4IU82_9GAST|nr:hypothetical protein ElyMa_001375200 [Elysia marginata]